MFRNKQYLKFLDNCREEKLDIVVTSVIETLGSTFTKSGNIMLVNSKGESTGVLGSNFLQNKVLESSKIALETRKIQNFDSIAKDPTSGHGNSTYQSEPFFYKDDYEGINEYIIAPHSLLIFGSGAHVSPLISMANLMGWKTTVIDLKLKNEYTNDADETIELKNLEDILTMDLTSYDSSVILSHNPNTDDTYLQALLNTNMHYIGLMGNSKNAQRKKEQFGLENSDRFFAPIGLNIGSYTPQSIALSICAQIESRKNGKI